MIVGSNALLGNPLSAAASGKSSFALHAAAAGLLNASSSQLDILQKCKIFELFYSLFLSLCQVVKSQVFICFNARSAWLLY